MNRFLADENLPLPVVAELRSLGYDVITIQEAGRGTNNFLTKMYYISPQSKVGLS